MLFFLRSFCIATLSLSAPLIAETNEDDDWNWLSHYDPDEGEEEEESEKAPLAPPPKPFERPRWYFVAKPGYYYFTDKDMRQFFDGGFTLRGEFGCRIWKPFYVWVDAGYLEKKGEPIGGNYDLKLQMASVTLGFKAIGYLHDRFAVYAGAGPRLLMTLLYNDSPYVRERDDHLGIGGGFIGGLWIFPFPHTNEIFFDLFADYTLNRMQLEEDLVSSYDNDVDASGLSFGVGVGVRF